MYVNKTKVMIALGSIKVKTIIWGILCGTVFLAFLGGLTLDMMAKYGWTSEISFLAVAAVCGVFLFLNIKKKQKINLYCQPYLMDTYPKSKNNLLRC